MAIIQLPHQDKIDRSSAPRSEGFAINEVSYSSKVFQRSFAGADAESSREEVWTVKWMHLEYYSPAEVLAGKVSTIDDIRSFYKAAHLNKVEWKPFEINQNRIWTVVPNTLKVVNPAGNVFEASLDLKFLYNTV